VCCLVVLFSKQASPYLLHGMSPLEEASRATVSFLGFLVCDASSASDDVVRSTALDFTYLGHLAHCRSALTEFVKYVYSARAGK
jgi:hypothetical protein